MNSKDLHVAIPPVEPKLIEQALSAFDNSLRHTEEWAHWEDSKAQVWALYHDGQRYPPKKIISMATGLPVSGFSGGPESNTFLESRGFKVGKLWDVSLSGTFELILDRYKPAKETLTFGGHHEIRELFTQARRVLEEWPPVQKYRNLHVVTSYGKGNWATIPWISLLDDRETRTTQDGTYAVYLFREDGKGVYLKLAQGVTKPHKEMGAAAFGVLAERAQVLRASCSSLEAAGFDMTGQSDLGTTQQLARLYEASTIAAKYYPRDNLPGDDQLLADLTALLSCYGAIVTAKPDAVASRSQDTRPLSLLGTWRGIQGSIAEVEQRIQTAGGFGSWWSFVIREEALPRLRPPFSLYAYDGEGSLAARMRVEEMVDLALVRRSP